MRWLRLIPVGALLLTVAVAAPAIARFVRAAEVGGNVVSTATLAVPTGMGATSSCSAPGSAQVQLTWSPSASSFADGYDVSRGTSPGGPYSLVAHVDGGATTSYTDAAVGMGTSYTYVVQTTGRGWTSEGSNEAAATTPTC